MALQHAVPSDHLDLPARAEDRGEETVVLVAAVVPAAAGADLPELLVEAAARLFGTEHLVDLTVLDDAAVAVTLGLKGLGAGRVADPALGPALEADLSAALRSAGHRGVSVAVASAGPPKSTGERGRELWQEKLDQVHARARRHAEETSFRTEIAQMLEGGDIRTMFQGIVRSTDGHLLGYEALSRGPQGHRWERPDLLLDAAHRAGLTSLVQWEMLRLARVRAAERLTSADHLLFVNAPDTCFWPDGPPHDSSPSEALWPWHRMVSEVSERSPIANLPAVWEARDRDRARGVRFALDDVGAGYAGLAALALLAPEFVKIDMALVRDCHREPAKQAVIAALVQYAKQAGAAVIAEGVETADESRVVCDLGVDLLQGFLFARPVEHPSR